MAERSPQTSPNGTKKGEPPNTLEKRVGLVVGVLCLLFVGFLLYRNEPFADPNFAVIARGFLSLGIAVAGGAAVSGFLHIHYELGGWFIRATGGLALFVLTFLYTPTVIPAFRSISSEVLGPHQYPPEAIIESRPSPEEIESEAILDPTDVTFSYVNRTSDDLKLFLFDFSMQHRQSKDAFAPSVFWQAWPFPADENYQSYSGFQKTSGWFAFAVGRSRPFDNSVEPFFLETRNIFYSHDPCLIVEETGDEVVPYRATFRERGDDS